LRLRPFKIPGGLLEWVASPENLHKRAPPPVKSGLKVAESSLSANPQAALRLGWRKLIGLQPGLQACRRNPKGPLRGFLGSSSKKGTFDEKLYSSATSAVLAVKPFSTIDTAIVAKC
jgi:hypothetical protein